jgi:hypothetical protein
MSYDEIKCLEMSQGISAIYDHADASLAECCSATALALRVRLDNTEDKILRGYMISIIMKHLTMDKWTAGEPKIDLLRPNGIR